MAEVWEGIDETLDRAVAVKILHSHLAADPEFLQRFRREAVAVGRLSHPNVVAVYDTGIDDGPGGATRAYIVMELVRGESLRTVAAKGLTLDAAVDIAAQVAEGLGYAHEHGLVHRDVKPANILVQPDHWVKVADFGIAKAAHAEGADEHDLTRAGAVLGTAKYLSPEQVEGRGADARSDIYAVGVVLYELACGRPPYVGKGDLATALLHVRGGAPRPRQVRPGIPRPLDELIVRAMAKNPADRYPTALDLARALRSLDFGPDDAEPLTTRLETDRTPPRGVTTTIARPPTAVMPRRGGRRRTSRLAIAGLALLGAVLGSGAGVVAADRTGGDDTARPVAVAGVTSYDPRGDGSENERQAPLVVDDSLATAWSTFDGRNEVGLVIELGPTAANRPLRDVVVSSLDTDWSAAVFVVDQPGSDLSDWGAPEDEVSGAGRTARLQLRGRRGRYVLLLLTDLGPGRRVRLSDVRVRA